MKCQYCEIVEENRGILYQDQEAVVAVKDTALAPGQVTIFPRNHFTILEMIPDDLLKKCSLLANTVGIAVFEALSCQGTNVLVQNGIGAGQSVPHFALEIIPRNENDGIDLQWQPLPFMEDELETTTLLLKEEVTKAQEPKNEKVTEKAEPIKKVNGEDSENYLFKSLKRLP